MKKLSPVYELREAGRARILGGGGGGGVLAPNSRNKANMAETQS